MNSSLEAIEEGCKQQLQICLSDVQDRGKDKPIRL